jgi:hypothetical protein
MELTATQTTTRHDQTRSLSGTRYLEGCQMCSEWIHQHLAPNHQMEAMLQNMLQMVSSLENAYHL